MSTFCEAGILVEGCLGYLAGGLLLTTILLFSLPCAIAFTLVLLWWFRTRVQRSMRATAGGSTDLEPYQSAPSGPRGELKIEVIDVTKEHSSVVRSTFVLAQLRRHVRQLAGVYAGTVCIQPLVLGVVLILGPVPMYNTMFTFVLGFILFFLVHATPLVLVPAFILKRQLWVLLLTVFAFLLVLWVFGKAIGVDSLGLWLFIASVPTGAVILLNIPRLRAVGPVMFAALLLFGYCTAIGVVYACLPAWEAIGPMRFVREDLAPLPLDKGVDQYLQWLMSLPARERLAEVLAVVENPRNFIKVANPQALTAELALTGVGRALTGAALGALLGFAFFRWLAVYYRDRRASDQMLTVDVLMVIFTLSSVLVLTAAFGGIVGACALGTLMGYAVSVRYWLQRRTLAAPSPVPLMLLLLRVFGFNRRTRRLLDDLGQYWRYLGPIQLIGGVDLAYSTLEPHEFFEFVNGRLTRAFVKNRADLESRLLENVATPDPDGLFRVEEFYCHDDTWRMTVSRVARNADAVLMDLRSFSSTNRGCIFEIEQLVASVSVQRIWLLIDRSTDLSFLTQTLQSAWLAMPTDSPNCVAGEQRLRILLASSSHRQTLNTLLGLLCDSAQSQRRADNRAGL
jgi:hypothetical protein